MTFLVLDPDIIRIRSSLICARSFCTSANCLFVRLEQGERQAVSVTVENHATYFSRTSYKRFLPVTVWELNLQPLRLKDIRGHFVTVFFIIIYSDISLVNNYLLFTKRVYHTCYLRITFPIFLSVSFLTFPR